MAVPAAALKMEVQTLRGRELCLAGLPAQQVSEKRAGLQVWTPRFCLVVRKAPTSPLVFSRGQKQRKGLGVCTFEGIVRWRLEIFATPTPDFLGRKQAWNGEAMPESRGAFPGAPVRCLHPLPNVWALIIIFAGVGTQGRWELQDFREAHPSPIEDKFAYFTRFDGKHNYCDVYAQHELVGAGWRSKLQLLSFRKSWFDSGFCFSWIEVFAVFYLVI